MQKKDNIHSANSKYIGISFVDLQRAERLAKSHHFFSRNFSENEQMLCKRSLIPCYVYGQFLAAKLACLKALNIGFEGQYKLCDIEIFIRDTAETFIDLHGKIEYESRLLGIEKILVSLSKNTEVAIATVACVTKYNKNEIIEEISIKDELNAAFKELRQLLV